METDIARSGASCVMNFPARRCACGVRPVGVAAEVGDRAHGNTGPGQIDNDLRQPLMPILRVAASAHQCNHVVAVVRVGGPDLLPIQQPPPVVGQCTRTYAGQIRARIRLTHADAEVRLTAANSGQIVPLRLFGTATKYQWAALPVSDPVATNRRAYIEELLDQHVTRKRRTATASVLPGDGDAEPATPADLAAEGGVVAGPWPGAYVGGSTAHGLDEEGADFTTQCFILWRYANRIQGTELIHACTSRCVTLSTFLLINTNVDGSIGPSSAKPLKQSIHRDRLSRKLETP